jgi:hypothetical protein
MKLLTYSLLAAIISMTFWVIHLRARLADSASLLAASEQKRHNLDIWIKEQRWLPKSGINISFPENLSVHSLWIYPDTILVYPGSGLGGKDSPRQFMVSSCIPPYSYNFTAKAGWVSDDGAYAINIPKDAPQECSVELK